MPVRQHTGLGRLAAGVVAAAALVMVSGCNTSSLTKVEMVVYFTPNAPAADHEAALKACAHAAPNVYPEPLTKSNLLSNSVGDVRFRVDHADDKDLALLSECLNKQPGVEGMEEPDLTD
jgi:hypothetical protein